MVNLLAPHFGLTPTVPLQKAAGAQLTSTTFVTLELMKL
jgi:hypothetical protein